MILCDSNVWLALALSKHSHHTAAREWLETVQAPASVLLCRATQQAFLRLITNAAVLGAYGNPPLTNRQAWSAYEALLKDDRIVFRADEPAGVEPLWKDLAMRGTASPKLWMDAYLAAFALAGQYRMVTTKRGVSPVPGIGSPGSFSGLDFTNCCRKIGFFEALRAFGSLESFPRAEKVVDRRRSVEKRLFGSTGQPCFTISVK